MEPSITEFPGGGREVRFLERYSDGIYALLRFVVGVLFACHGAQKLFGVLGGQAQTGVPLLLVAGIIEFASGIFVAAGLFAGPAAFIASGQMAVAYFKAHASNGFWPIENRGELAVLYCFLLLYIASRGSGRHSLDGVVRRWGGTATELNRGPSRLLSR